MHKTKKGNQWHFGMEAHIGVFVESGLVHTVIGTAARINDVTRAASCCTAKRSLLGAMQVTREWTSARRCPSAWLIGTSPCALANERRSTPLGELHKLLENAERLKASLQVKVEHPFRVNKPQFGYAKVRYRGPGAAVGHKSDATEAEAGLQRRQSRT